LFVITGATGNTGCRIAAALLKAGKEVRIIGRSADKMKSLTDQGAQAFVASLDDADALTKAFSGASAVYAMIPPDSQVKDFRAYQGKIGEAITAAIHSAGIKYIVHLSSMGAENSEGVGPVNGLYDQEQRLNKLEGVNLLHLRPGYFLENTLMQVGMIKQMGIMGSPVRGDVKFGMIATQDIADYAAKRLLKLDFSGKSIQELQGQRDVSYDELAVIYGKAIGKSDLKYVCFPPADAVQGMMQMGLSESVANSYVELALAGNTGRLHYNEPRSAENTTKTSPEEFAQLFAAIYKA
jgi:uncharacterized protein YbjT (DUF2867 family)